MLERAGLSLILGLYGLFAVGYSLLMPMWEAPDESAHFVVIHFLARRDRLPTYEETYEAVQPPLYYWVASGVVRLLDRVDPELSPLYRPPLSAREERIRYAWAGDNYRFMWGQQLLRWLNIVVGGFTLVFIYKAARIFTQEWQGGAGQVIPLATAAVIGLTPQYLHNSAAISNDPVANLGGAILFWCLALLCYRSLRGWHLVGIGAAALAFPLLLKATIVPISLVVLVVATWQLRRAWLPRWLWLLGSGLLVGVVLVAGVAYFAPEAADLLRRSLWWRITFVRDDFPRHWPLYRIAAFYIAGYWGQVAWEDVRLPAGLILGLTGWAAVGWLASWRLLFGRLTLRRFWLLMLAPAVGLLLAGWLVSRRSDWWFVPPVVFAFYLAVWLMAFGWQQWRDPAVQVTVNRWVWASVWLAAGLAILVVFKNFLTTPQYQGRFFFPSLGPLALLMTAGWFALLPPRLAAYLPYFILAFLIGCNLVLWVTRVIPIYYQPFFD